jgi:long-chain acyl-CoA synthetase
MSHQHRLFDCVAEQLKKGGNEAMLAAKESGTWRKYSTAEVKTVVDQLSAGLLALGSALSNHPYQRPGVCAE